MHLMLYCRHRDCCRSPNSRCCLHPSSMLQCPYQQMIPQHHKSLGRPTCQEGEGGALHGCPVQQPRPEAAGAQAQKRARGVGPVGRPLPCRWFAWLKSAAESGAQQPDSGLQLTAACCCSPLAGEVRQMVPSAALQSPGWGMARPLTNDASSLSRPQQHSPVEMLISRGCRGRTLPTVSTLPLQRQPAPSQPRQSSHPFPTGGPLLRDIPCFGAAMSIWQQIGGDTAQH